MNRGPLKPDQLRELLADIDLLELPDVLQKAARMAIAQHRPGLLTEEQIEGLVDLDTLTESGDHIDLHAAYQAAASMGALLVLELAVRRVPAYHAAGPECYTCKLCDSVRAATPESIAHRGDCADIRARIRGTV